MATKENITELQNKNKIAGLKLDILKKIDDNLEIAKKLHKIQPYFYTKGLFWFWNYEQNRYVELDDHEIFALLDEKAECTRLIKPAQRNELLNALKHVGTLKKPKEAPKTWLQFKNCIYDVKTKEFHRVSPEYFLTNPIPWNFIQEDTKKGFAEFLETGEKPQEEHTKFDDLFTQWVGEEYKDLLFELVGYCMLPDYPLHRIFCLTGSGLNGKGTFMEVLTKTVGLDNVCSTELDDLINSRFEISRLHKKLVCLMGETNFEGMSRTSKLKKLSGGDLIGFEYKHKGHFEDYNYAKLIIATNGLPITHDKTDGFYRRWLIIDFPNRFTEKKNVLECLTQGDYESLVRKAVNALERVIYKREFTREGTIEERRAKYEDRSNPLGIFLRENTVEDPNGVIPRYVFRNKFQHWLKENGHRVMSDREIGTLMNDLYETRKQEVEGHENRIRVYVGLRWNVLKNGDSGNLKDYQKTSEVLGEKSSVQLDQLDQGFYFSFPYTRTKLKYMDKLDKLDTFINKFEKITSTRNKGYILDYIEVLELAIQVYQIDSDQAKKVIDKLLEQGVLYQPKPDKFTLLK